MRGAADGRPSHFRAPSKIPDLGGAQIATVPFRRSVMSAPGCHNRFVVRSYELADEWIDSAIAFVHIQLMSRFEATFLSAVANAEREVLVDQIRANPKMSLQELGKLATGQLGGLLGQITLGDLIGGRAPRGDSSPARKPVGRKAAVAVAAAPPAAVAARKGKADGGGRKAPAAEVDTRTAEGRAAYDAAVLAALKGLAKPASASNLTSVAGGSPLQIRTALARLIETGAVHWSGRARGTRYTPA